MLAVARHDSVQAANLFGAAETLREAAGAPMTSVEREEYDAAIGELKRQLEPPTRDIAWAAGRNMNLNDAVATALLSRVAS